MDLALLEKTFQNLEMPLDYRDAKDKALLFVEALKSHAIILPDDDYWLQIAGNWDMNICEPSVSPHYLCLYPIYMMVNSKGDYSIDTDTSHPWHIL